MQQQLAPSTSPPTGPMLDLERRLLDAMTDVEHFFRTQWQEHSPPFYGSVDLRYAGFKLAPVDMNLFPGGFNNLGDDALPCAVQAAQAAVEHSCPTAKRLLLVPERHTRNIYYLTNVARLVRILTMTGAKVRVGTLSEEVTAPTPVSLPGGETLTIEPLVRTGNRVGVAHFDPCVVLLNNDLSAGIPDILRDLEPSQTLLPPLHAGWAVRRKSNHFAAYDDVAAGFAKLLDIDPWTLNPYFARCGKVNFQDRGGEECLASNVEQVLTRIKAKYQEYGISDAPFVIVKADAGTYGMGIMTVRDPSEVIGLNRKQRNKMAVVKEGLEVSEVIIQEGVPTVERVDGATAEPVVYMVDRYVVGGFYRVNRERGIDENLNAPGAHYVPLAFTGSCNLPERRAAPGASGANRLYSYGVAARLALLAAAVELERTVGADRPAAEPAPVPAPRLVPAARVG